MAEGAALALPIPAWSLRAALDLGCVPALPAMGVLAVGVFPTQGSLSRVTFLGRLWCPELMLP